MIRQLGITATLIVALVGCASAPSSPPATIAIPETTTPAPPPPPALPTSVDIPSIGVHATKLMPLGLDKNGVIETPSVKTPQVLGYYTRGGAPCIPGPQKVSFALIGHIDGSGQKGVLYNLKHLKADDVVTVGLDNGKSCTYRINKLAQFEKQDFPVDTVWGPVADAQIRVVSCGGPWVGAPYGYRDNLIGMGSLVS